MHGRFFSSHEFSYEKCSEIFPEIFEPLFCGSEKIPGKFPPNFPLNFPNFPAKNKKFTDELLQERRENNSEAIFHGKRSSETVWIVNTAAVAKHNDFQRDSVFSTKGSFGYSGHLKYMKLFRNNFPPTPERAPKFKSAQTRTFLHSLGSGFGRTDFSRIFIFGPPDFFADFLAGFFLLIFVGKSAQKNPPGKSPRKSSKIYTTKVLRHISAEWPGQHSSCTKKVRFCALSGALFFFLLKLAKTPLRT